MNYRNLRVNSCRLKPAWLTAPGRIVYMSLSRGSNRFMSSKRARGLNGRHKCPCLFCNWDRALLVALDAFIADHVTPRFPAGTALFRKMVNERILMEGDAVHGSSPDLSA